MTDSDLLQQLAQLIADKTPCATAQVVRATGSIPNEIGAMLIAGEDGALLGGTIGGGRIEHQTLAAAAEAIRTGKSRLLTSKLTEEESGGIGMLCGGSVDVFIHVHQRAPRLLLCGAGHINVCLARMAEGLGYDVTVVDDRPEWANVAHYPEAEIVVARPEAVMADLGVDRDTYIVVGTRDGDADVIVAASKTPARYIGVVASKRKAIQLVKEISDRADLASLAPRLYGPTGLDLGGRSPKAVALSILSEVQALRYGKGGGAMRVLPDKLLCYAKRTAER